MAAVKVALVGAGAWGRVLTKAAAASSKIEFICCVGRSPERLAAFSKDTALPVRDFGSVLADRDIDGVVLTLPNELHCAFATRAAEAGKHVYIEKPIATNMIDSLAIAALEPAYGVRVVVGHCARLLAGVRLIRQGIDAGELGRVTQLEATFSNDRGLRITAADWRWYAERAPGGSLSQIGVHQFDTLRYLGGDIAAVSASAAQHAPTGAEVEDQWIVTVHFADGKLGTIISNWTSPGTFSVRATGFDALMFYEMDQTHWAMPERAHEGASLFLQARGKGPGERQSITLKPSNMYRDELELFADSLQTGVECELSAANGLQAITAVHAALKSAEEGSRRVTLREVLDAADGARTAEGSPRRRTTG